MSNDVYYSHTFVLLTPKHPIQEISTSNLPICVPFTAWLSHSIAWYPWHRFSIRGLSSIIHRDLAIGYWISSINLIESHVKLVSHAHSMCPMHCCLGARLTTCHSRQAKHGSNISLIRAPKIFPLFGFFAASVGQGLKVGLSVEQNWLEPGSPSILYPFLLLRCVIYNV